MCTPHTVVGEMYEGMLVPPCLKHVSGNRSAVLKDSVIMPEDDSCACSRYVSISDIRAERADDGVFRAGCKAS